jgi:hypothetical protein
MYHAWYTTTAMKFATGAIATALNPVALWAS